MRILTGIRRLLFQGFSKWANPRLSEQDPPPITSRLWVGLVPSPTSSGWDWDSCFDWKARGRLEWPARRVPSSTRIWEAGMFLSLLHWHSHGGLGGWR